MRYLPLAAVLIAGAIAFPSIASAGPLQTRLNHQDRRIYTGVQNGSLTLHEYRRLEHRGDVLQARRARDIRDGGGLTPREAFRLNRSLNQQSHRIYQQKHD
jgi:hypothetical protein